MTESLFRIYAGPSGASPPYAGAEPNLAVLFSLGPPACYSQLQGFAVDRSPLSALASDSFPSCPWPLQGFSLCLASVYRHRYLPLVSLAVAGWTSAVECLLRDAPQGACVRSRLTTFRTFTLLGVDPPGNSPGSELFTASGESPALFRQLAGFALSSGRHL